MSWTDERHWKHEPGKTVWATDETEIFQAVYHKHPEEEVLDMADEGHYSPPGKEDWVSVSYIWTGPEKPSQFPL